MPTNTLNSFIFFAKWRGCCPFFEFLLYKHSRDPIFGLTLPGTLFEFAYRKPQWEPLFALPPK